MDEQSILQQGQTCQFQSEKKKKEKRKPVLHIIGCYLNALQASDKNKLNSQ